MYLYIANKLAMLHFPDPVFNKSIRKEDTDIIL